LASALALALTHTPNFLIACARSLAVLGPGSDSVALSPLYASTTSVPDQSLRTARAYLPPRPGQKSSTPPGLASEARLAQAHVQAFFDLLPPGSSMPIGVSSA
jgi:hypothetical protein